MTMIVSKHSATNLSITAAKNRPVLLAMFTKDETIKRLFMFWSVPCRAVFTDLNGNI